MWSVYEIKNTDSGKCYIGLTSNLANRLRNHFGKLKSGTHDNEALQKDFDAGNHFVSSPIVRTASREKAMKLERLHLKRQEIKPYNINRGGATRKLAADKRQTILVFVKLSIVTKYGGIDGMRDHLYKLIGEDARGFGKAS